MLCVDIFHTLQRRRTLRKKKLRGRGRNSAKDRNKDCGRERERGGREGGREGGGEGEGERERERKRMKCIKDQTLSPLKNLRVKDSGVLF